MWRSCLVFLLSIVTINIIHAETLPLARHKGLVATADAGFDCAKPSTIAVTAPSEDAFQGDKIPLNILLAAARAGLEAKCPGNKVPDLIVRGLVADKEAYWGALNAATSWILVDLTVPPSAPQPNQTAESSPAAPPINPSQSELVLGKWIGTQKAELKGIYDIELVLTPQGGVISYKGFMVNCTYAIKPLKADDISEKDLILSSLLASNKGCPQEAKFRLKSKGNDVETYTTFSDGLKYGGELKFVVGPYYTLPKVPSMPLESGGFVFTESSEAIEKKIRDIYGEKSVGNSKTSLSGAYSYLGFADKEQAFIPRKFSDENHVREILTISQLTSIERVSRPWMKRIWTPVPVEAPMAKNVKSDLLVKYGSPSLTGTMDGYGRDSDDIVLEWHFNIDGKLLNAADAENCRYKQKEPIAKASLERGWKNDIDHIGDAVREVALSYGCGYSMVIFVDSGDTGRLRELTVAFYNQPHLLMDAWDNLSFGRGSIAQRTLDAHSQGQSNKSKL